MYRPATSADTNHSRTRSVMLRCLRVPPSSPSVARASGGKLAGTLVRSGRRRALCFRMGCSFARGSGCLETLEPQGVHGREIPGNGALPHAKRRRELNLRATATLQHELPQYHTPGERQEAPAAVIAPASTRPAHHLVDRKQAAVTTPHRETLSKYACLSSDLLSSVA